LETSDWWTLERLDAKRSLASAGAVVAVDAAVAVAVATAGIASGLACLAAALEEIWPYQVDTTALACRTA